MGEKKKRKSVERYRERPWFIALSVRDTGHLALLSLGDGESLPV